MKPISEETKQRAVAMYKKGELTVAEISNLVDVSVSHLNKIFREYIDKGVLTPRQATNKNNKKFTEEQERQIAIDYYENNLSANEVKKKWGIHPMQLQRIRNKYRSVYGIKANAPCCFKPGKPGNLQ